MPAPSTIVPIAKFFGKKEGQTTKQLMDEIRELSEEDQQQLAEGIRNETLTY